MTDCSGSTALPLFFHNVQQFLTGIKRKNNYKSSTSRNQEESISIISASDYKQI
jgi:hypothetical protein